MEGPIAFVTMIRKKSLRKDIIVCALRTVKSLHSSHPRFYLSRWFPLFRPGPCIKKFQRKILKDSE